MTINCLALHRFAFERHLELASVQCAACQSFVRVLDDACGLYRYSSIMFQQRPKVRPVHAIKGFLTVYKVDTERQIPFQGNTHNDDLTCTRSFLHEASLVVTY